MEEKNEKTRENEVESESEIILVEVKYQGPDHVQLTKVNWRLKVNWKFF